MLYIVGTPIGNLSDISARALETLEQVDVIACEDTRVSRKLLTHFDIKKPLISYHAHNEKRMGEEILQKLFDGQQVALISDAGMPCVSDPGEALVALCAQHGIEIQVIPGASAFVAALALSGLPSGRFVFEGFLPVATKERRLRLQQLKEEPRSMIFYEAPHKLKKTLADFQETFGERNISISRELTKRFEQTLRLTLTQAIAYFTAHEPRGEFVLVVEGAAKQEVDTVDIASALLRLQEEIDAGTPRKQAIKEIAAETGIAKNLLYSESLKQIDK